MKYDLYRIIFITIVNVHVRESHKVVGKDIYCRSNTVRRVLKIAPQKI